MFLLVSSSLYLSFFILCSADIQIQYGVFHFLETQHEKCAHDCCIIKKVRKKGYTAHTYVIQLLLICYTPIILYHRLYWNN